MPPKRKINGQAFINDIRAGMSDTELMLKYKLSSRMLQSLFRTLLNTKAITPAEIYERTPFEDTTIDVNTLSYSFEGYTIQTTSIYDVTQPEKIGHVTSITERELRTEGIAADFAETKTFILLSGKAAKINPIFLRAKCRWCRRDEVTGDDVAMFEIVSIGQEHAKELKKLIRAFSRQVTL
ncbi:MAG: hypothetical protein V1792_20785 [Pseudomonadota bacterium]